MKRPINLIEKSEKEISAILNQIEKCDMIEGEYIAKQIYQAWETFRSSTMIIKSEMKNLKEILDSESRIFDKRGTIDTSWMKNCVEKIDDSHRQKDLSSKMIETLVICTPENVWGEIIE